MTKDQYDYLALKYPLLEKYIRDCEARDAHEELLEYLDGLVLSENLVLDT